MGIALTHKEASMTIHVSSRRATLTAATEATTETHSPQPGTGGTASTRPSAARPQDVVSQVERGRAGLIDRDAFWNSMLAE